MIEKRTLRNLVLGAAVAIACTGIVFYTAKYLSNCDRTRTEASEILHEDANVVARIHTPSTHTPSLSPSVMKLDDNFGIGMDGDMGMSMGDMVVSSSEVPERYGVVFRCQHGSFTSEGSDTRHKDLYDRLHEGEEVDVTYKELYRATLRKVNPDGKRVVVKRVLTGYDFLDAQPKAKEAKK